MLALQLQNSKAPHIAGLLVPLVSQVLCLRKSKLLYMPFECMRFVQPLATLVHHIILEQKSIP